MSPVATDVDVQWDWLEATVHEKGVLKCIMTAPGAQCVMMDLMTQQQQLYAALSNLGTFIYECHRPFIRPSDVFCISSIFIFVSIRQTLAKPAQRQPGTNIGDLVLGWTREIHVKSAKFDLDIRHQSHLTRSGFETKQHITIHTHSDNLPSYLQTNVIAQMKMWPKIPTGAHQSPKYPHLWGYLCRRIQRRLRECWSCRLVHNYRPRN